MGKSLSAEVGEAEKREALDRVLASNAFHRTGQLKTLLKYVCEREIAGQGGSLDECTVAVEGLGRPPDYSPFEDGTVRNRIHNLRRRLEQYYETDNPSDPVHIVVPRGSYCPVFEPWPPATVAVAAVEDPAPAGAVPVPPMPSRNWSRPVPLWNAIALCAIAVLATGSLMAWLYSGLRHDHPDTDPVLAEAWGPILARNSNPLLCIATAAQLTLIQRPLDPPIGPKVSAPDLQAWYQTLPGLPPSKQVYLGPSLTSPFWGDVAGALAAANVLTAAGVKSELLPETVVQMPALNKRNLLMFGRPGFSRNIDLYLADKPFRVRIPDQEHVTVIWNTAPKPGELPEYDADAASRADHREIAFGLITVIPSPGDANLRTVIFSGTLSPGTEAAAEFFSSPKHLRALLHLFKKEGFATFPAAYQVVVRSTVFNTSALDVRYVTHRVISEAADRGR